MLYLRTWTFCAVTIHWIYLWERKSTRIDNTMCVYVRHLIFHLMTLWFIILLLSFFHPSGRAIWLRLEETWADTPGRCCSPQHQTAQFPWASSLLGRPQTHTHGDNADVWEERVHLLQFSSNRRRQTQRLFDTAKTQHLLRQIQGRERISLHLNPK